MKKSGAAELASSATSGNTIDLSSLDPPVAPSRRGGAGPIGSSPAPAKPPRGAARASQPPSPAKGSAGTRLDVDDLFGMSELTGGAAAPGSKPKSGIDFGSLDLDDEPIAPVKPKTGPLAPERPVTSKTKTGPMKQEPPASRPKTGPVGNETSAPRPKTGPVGAGGAKVNTGPLDANGRPKPKTGPVREAVDASSGLELDESALEKKGSG
ncbi:MAG TPA: hypothetical protein VJ144_05660, partial [Candidatus Polarisedimenticolia bacterium]|nr:hypothetical protein [Candidatus Polarisedimenticolia bacterium]